MQFLPTTWAQAGVVRATSAIPTTRFMRRPVTWCAGGGLKDIRRGLWGYNNSDNYGNAVLTYASLVKEDPKRLCGALSLDIHFAAAAGDLGCPLVTTSPRSIAVFHLPQPVPGQRTASRIFWLLRSWGSQGQRYFSGSAS